MTLQKQSVLLPAVLLNLLIAFSFSGKPTSATPAPFRSHAVNDTPLVTTSPIKAQPSVIEGPEQSLNAFKPAVPLNTSAASFTKRFLKQSREELALAAKRSAVVFKTIDPVFAQQNLPKTLRYLAVVESGLKREARSRVGATGLWQLMPETARDLGLTVTRKGDERKSVYKSTVAAARYLKALYREYEDWLLVIAAYNAGPGVVNKAIRRAGSRNFWKMQAFLPAETRGHVKRFIATHYYFESDGGVTTVTKGEWAAYVKTEAARKAATGQPAMVENVRLQKDSLPVLSLAKGDR